MSPILIEKLIAFYHEINHIQHGYDFYRMISDVLILSLEYLQTVDTPVKIKNRVAITTKYTKYVY